MFVFRMLRCRPHGPIRRPVALLGAACTSAILGFLFLNKVLLNGATCMASCAANRQSYERLQKNEASRKVRPAHSTAKGFDVNFLPSNSPIEDRFVVGVSPNLGAAMFSVIDGHKGFRCSEYLQGHLLRYITEHLWKETNKKETRGEDLEILLDMHQVTSLKTNPKIQHEEEMTDGYTPSSDLPEFSESTLEKTLLEAFVSLDNDISNTALNDVQWIHKGHSFTNEFKERILRAVEGACAIATVVMKNTVTVASTGDCRVVVGRKLSTGEWKAVPLSVDQNADNPLEVDRMKSAHPGEEDTVIMGNRVLGNLMPFRTFGDVDFKWETKYLNGLAPIQYFYRSPPYITAEPVVTHHTVEEGDKFMILASDGLWERMSNEKAVEIVANTLSKPIENASSSLFRLFKREREEESCCHSNAATVLLWQALGGTEESVTTLLDIPAPMSRMYRDDITVMVVYFQD